MSRTNKNVRGARGASKRRKQPAAKRRKRTSAFVPRFVLGLALAGAVPALVAGCGDDSTPARDSGTFRVADSGFSVADASFMVAMSGFSG